MEEFAENQKPVTEFPSSDSDSVPESIQVIPSDSSSKTQHADDIALMQCILCIIAILLFFGLHWLKPEWQEWFLSQYRLHRNAPTLQWIDLLLQSIQDWIKQ